MPEMPTNRPVSLKDLAGYLGLSRSTVSLVLNNSPVAQGLAPQTRERILLAAKKMGYRPNYFARMLNNKRSFMVGIMSPDLAEGYDSEILNGIELALNEKDYLYFVSSHHWNSDRIKKRLDEFTARGAEGFILINTPAERTNHLPIVTIGPSGDDPTFTSILVDNRHGVHLSLEHLASLGHKKVAFFRGHQNSSDTAPRWDATMELAPQFGIELDPDLLIQLERVDSGTNPVQEGYMACEKLLAQNKKFTALMAFNDMTAIGAIRCLRDHNISIPGQVSVIGFDDVLVSSMVEPTLTTIRQPLVSMGKMAATRIMDLIQNPEKEPEQIEIKPELIARKSTAHAPALS